MKSRSPTGRLTSNEPALQRLPLRTKEGKDMQKAFQPGPDHVLVRTDYSQIEFRLWAHILETFGG